MDTVAGKEGGEMATQNSEGTLLAVSVGKPRDFDYQGRDARSAIWKTAVKGRVPVQGVNLAGDDQADRKAHGGTHKAVYAYSIEDYRWWEEELGRPLSHATFGENLTTEGMDLSGAVVGERWEIGSVILEVSEPRVPCWRLGVRMEDKMFPKRFTQAGRPGTYFRIFQEGDLGEGDRIRILERPDHGVTVGEVFRIYAGDRKAAGSLLEVEQLSEPWKDWARRMTS
jgi:MOSC domain-containing protein YiiM